MKMKIFPLLLLSLSLFLPLESASGPDDYARLEEDVRKSYREGHYPRLYDTIEKLLLQYPDKPESILYFYDPVRLADACGFPRVRDTLAKVIHSLEENRGLPQRNIRLLALRLEMEKLLYRFSARDAEKLSGELHPVRTWDVMGPFNRYGPGDLEYPFLPEMASRSDDKEMKRKRIAVSHPDGWLDFKKFLFPDYGAAYAVTTMKTGAPVRIRIYSSASYKLFINGREVLKNMANASHRRYRVLRVWDTGAVTLMVKLYQKDAWSFRVIVTDDADAVMEPSLDIDNPVFSDFKFTEERDYPFTYFAEKARDNPGDYLFRLGNYFDELDSPEAFEFYRKAYRATRDPFTLFFLGESLIEYSRDDRSSAYFLEGWKIVGEMAGTNRDFVPLRYRAFEKLLESRSYLPAYREGRALMEKGRYYLPFRLDFADLLKGLGYDREFEEEMKSLATDFPSSNLPRLKLAEYFRERDVSRSAALYRSILAGEESPKALSALLEILKEQQKYSEADALMREHDPRGDHKNDLIEMLIDAGETDRARQILLEALAARDDPYYYLKLGLISHLKDLDPVMYWKKMLTVNPSYFSLQDLLDYMDRGRLESPFEQYRMNKRWEALRSMIPADAADNPYVILYRGRVYQLCEDGGSRVFHEDIIYLKDQKGIERWGEYRVPFRGAFTPVRVRIYNREGGYSDSYRIQKVDDDHYINLSSLKPGSIIHIAYLVNNPIMEPRRSLFLSIPFELFQDYDEPVVRSSLRVIAPERMSVRFRLAGPCKLETERVEGQTLYSVELANLPAVRREDYMGHRMNYLPGYSFSTMTDMKDFVHWYGGLLAGALDLEPGTMTARFKAASLEKSVNRVYDFVAREIDLSGSALYYPEKARDTLLRKSGTPEDKAVLAHALLKNLGIRSYLAFARPWDMPDPGAFVSPHVFTNILLYVPLDVSSGLWLDFSSATSGCGTVDERITGTDALILVRDGFEMKTIGECCSHGTVATFTLSLGESGDAELSMELSYLGRSGNIRKHFRDRLYHEDAVNFYAASVLPSMSIDDFTLENLKEFALPFVIKVRGNCPGLATAGKDKLLLQPILNRSDLFQYVRYSERKHPLVIGAVNEREVYAYILPPAYRSFALSRNHEVRCRFGTAVIRVEKPAGKDTMRVEKEIKIGRTRILPSEYKDFLDFCLKLKNIESQNIVLTK